jgi:hypothetical protein
MDGVHYLFVRATDAAGNQGIGGFHCWLDTVDPTVRITGGPSSSTEPAVFTFSASEASRFRCSLNGAAYTACGATTFSRTGSWEVGCLQPGIHTLGVYATDRAGNVGPIAGQQFTVYAPG